MNIVIYLAGFLLVGLNFFAEAEVLKPVTDPKCPHQLYRVGLGKGGQFRELYRTCYDRNHVAAKYTQHTIYPASSVACSPYSWRLSNIITGQQASSFKNDHIRSVTSPSFPSYDRSHLAACADFSTAEARQATFEIINAVPQLSHLNQGEWKSMEKFFRDKATKRGVDVVTGGLGVLQYNGKAIFLYGTSGNPIPEFMYKVARVREAKREVLYAFIAYNYNGPMNPQRLAAYCDKVGCPNGFKQIICCDPRKFIEKNLHAFKSFFGI